MNAEGIASFIKGFTAEKVSVDKPLHVFLQMTENLT
jgi:hypothetical protein